MHRTDTPVCSPVLLSDPRTGGDKVMIRTSLGTGPLLLTRGLPKDGLLRRGSFGLRSPGRKETRWRNFPR